MENTIATTEQDIKNQLAKIRREIASLVEPCHRLECYMTQADRRAMLRYVQSFEDHRPDPIGEVVKKLERATKGKPFGYAGGSLRWEERRPVRAEMIVDGAKFGHEFDIPGIAGIVGTVVLQVGSGRIRVRLFHRLITHPFYQYGYHA